MSTCFRTVLQSCWKSGRIMWNILWKGQCLLCKIGGAIPVRILPLHLFIHSVNGCLQLHPLTWACFFSNSKCHICYIVISKRSERSLSHCKERVLCFKLLQLCVLWVGWIREERNLIPVRTSPATQSSCLKSWFFILQPFLALVSFQRSWAGKNQASLCPIFES